MAIGVTVADAQGGARCGDATRAAHPERPDRAATITRMSTPSRSTIRVPRWIQLVGLPVLLLVIWMLAGILGHAIFLFLVSAVIAFLLNPLVRDLQRMQLPRGAAVALVFLLFAAAVTFVALALGSVVVDQTRSATDRIDDYVTVKNASGQTGAEQDIDRLQLWLDTHGLERIQIEKQATDWADNLGAGEISKYTPGRALVRPGGGDVDHRGLFNIILIVVISIYMLLDMRAARAPRRPPLPAAGGLPLTRGSRRRSRATCAGS